MSFTADATGGKYEITLRSDQIAPHNHPANRFFVNSAGGNTVSVGNGNLLMSYFEDSSVHTDNSRGGEPHDNIQPYKVAYIWKRTA